MLRENSLIMCVLKISPTQVQYFPENDCKAVDIDLFIVYDMEAMSENVCVSAQCKEARQKNKTSKTITYTAVSSKLQVPCTGMIRPFHS